MRRRGRFKVVTVNAKKRQPASHCPACNSKTRTKVYEDTVLLNCPLFCPKCGKEYVVNVVQLKMQGITEPDD